MTSSPSLAPAVSEAGSSAHPQQETPSPLRLLVAFLVLGVLVVGTRVPLNPRYLFSFDSVNFALSLQRFDPGFHQPQPPGYPAFVAQARLVNHLFHSPERTFLACKVLATVLAPFLLFLLGARMYSPWTGKAAALLLLVNPLFWHASLGSPIRPYLAVGTVLVAYLCYRAAHGETRYAYYAAVALGLSAGWRPALGVLLFPLWFYCAWCALRSVWRLLAALALMTAAVLVWLAPLVAVIGGIRETYRLFSGYLLEQSADSSPVLGGDFWGWWKMFTYGLAWSALCVVGWLWAAFPLLWKVKQVETTTPSRRFPWGFLLWWVSPPVLFFILIHVESPGHMLSVVPALCLVGAVCLERGAERTSHWLSRRSSPRWAFLAIALAVNIAFFLFPFGYPNPQHKMWLSSRVARDFRYWGIVAVRDTCYSDIQGVDMRTADRVGFLNALGDRSDLAIVWQDDEVVWRKITYYFPDKPVWVLEGLNGTNATGSVAPRLWRANRAIEAHQRGDLSPLRLPVRGRVAWLLHGASSFPADLRAQGVPLREFDPNLKYLTDLSAAPQRFRAGPFLFQKTDMLR